MNFFTTIGYLFCLIFPSVKFFTHNRNLETNTVLNYLQLNLTNFLKDITHQPSIPIKPDFNNSLILNSKISTDTGYFQGQWKSKPPSNQDPLLKQFDYLETQQGYIYLQFIPIESEFSNEMNMIQAIISEDEFIDHRIVKTKISLLYTYNQTEKQIIKRKLLEFQHPFNFLYASSWQTTGETKALMNYHQQLHARPISYSNTWCALDYDIQIEKEKNDEEIFQSYFLRMNIQGKNCTFNVQTQRIQFIYPGNDVHSILAGIFFTTLGLVNMIFSAKLFFDINLENLELRNELSLMTITIIICYNFYISFLPFDFSHKISGFLVSINIIYYILFNIQAMWLLKTLTRFDLFRMKNLIYLFGTGGIFFYTQLNFGYSEYISFPLIFYLTPQIVQNVVRKVKPKFLPHYHILILSTPFIFGIYLKGCPQNFQKVSPNYVYAFFWAFFYILQLAICYLQSVWGPFFFIPKRLRPGYFNYYQKRQLKENQEVELCPICLCKLNQDIKSLEMVEQGKPFKERTGDSDDHQNDVMISENVSLNSQYQILQDQHDSLVISFMETPCNHQYHEFCLKKSIEIKLECPLCRAILPPLEV